MRNLGELVDRPLVLNMPGGLTQDGCVMHVNYIGGRGGVYPGYIFYCESTSEAISISGRKQGPSRVSPVREGSKTVALRLKKPARFLKHDEYKSIN